MTIDNKQATHSKLDKQQMRELQSQLDDIQDSGVTPEFLRYVLFQKMLDVYQVPKDHALRGDSTPERLDDPALINHLHQLGFAKRSAYH
ncbi:MULTISPECIES: hypothetical protein [Pseudoalteromonas]|uniref:Uncharacterized protein n=1 Tax=Pseudoalteromonas ruthenica TaxID=151081 RepID=A0A0F4Q0D0_9GAMM|nr:MULTISPECIES: hypothetical protein [Pseudoalteromonas]KJZ00820.1 hypothetical protein TW76_01005 [Pseudoalteromonas ruthenica]KJZ01127.1 hypothetical protein TW72_04600 [Pseudoalteromonas ruthenica]MCF2863100.1 hypothetical protein [Pseudoalteromonas sp. CNAT2-18]MCG7543025.1 hypothetical protein [Pseudoalteromonas sp. MM17-2]MCG7559252.1 hypothetical protein [Pseudoalteromonas sp. CNAT2-18.1]|tara:strand:+ start:628 stop:894 length:267 start_codon:yes stop_codon:yes gene_type:complete